MTTDMRSNAEIIGREGINDIDAILSLPYVTEKESPVANNCDSMFTWDYGNYGDTRPQLTRLYRKAKSSQWNGDTDLDWSIDVDAEKEAVHTAAISPEIAYYKEAAGSDRSCPLFGWTDEHFTRFAMEQRRYFLGQTLHGEQGAMICTAKINETVPWIEAKYYASTQVMDEARHVEVFSRYVDEKLGGLPVVSPHLFALLDDIIAESRWDMTYLGMQIIVEGLALTAFSILAHLTQEPLLKRLLRLVMSDEARHVAFGVISLGEAYEGMSAAEIRERQEFAFESGVRIRDRAFAQELWETMGVDPRAMLEWLVANGSRDRHQYTSPLFAKIVPNVKKLGLLDAGDGWLRQKYTEMGVIGFEDLTDTAEEYGAFDIVAQEGPPAQS